jgi:hypothetical protein
VDQTRKFDQIASRLIGQPGIRSIRWTDKEAGHVVTIDWTGATLEQRRAIKAQAEEIVDANLTHLFLITMAAE